MDKVLKLAALAVLLPLAAQSQVANGLYEEGGCRVPQSSAVVRVSPGYLSFFESACALSNARGVANRPGAVAYDAICDGEGQRFTTTYTLQAAGPNLILSNDGYTFTYYYCGP